MEVGFAGSGSGYELITADHGHCHARQVILSCRDSHENVECWQARWLLRGLVAARFIY